MKAIHDLKIDSKAHVEQKSYVLIGWFQSLDNVSMCDSTYVCSVLKFVKRIRFYIHRVKQSGINFLRTFYIQNMSVYDSSHFLSSKAITVAKWRNKELAMLSRRLSV